MENCTLYSHQLGFDKIEPIIQQFLPKAILNRQDNSEQKSLWVQSKKGLLSRKYTVTFTCRERLSPSYQLTGATCPLTQNLIGMTAFVQALPAQNTSIQHLLVQKIATLNTEITVTATPYISEDFEQILKCILQELDGILFTPPTSLFSKSKEQQFLNKELNLILDIAGISEVDDLAVHIDSHYYDQAKTTYTSTQIARKEKSESILQQQQIKINANLPCIPSSEHITLRSQEAIVNRIYALTAITAKAEGVSKEKLDQLIQEKAIQHFSPYEQQALKQTLAEETLSILTWRYESLFLLLWMINKVDSLPYPNQMCVVPQVMSPILEQSRIEFEEGISLRNIEEVLDLLDLTYRMNWACVDARIQQKQPTGALHPGIVYERHYALNWLINYQNQTWDNVQTNT